MANRTVQIKGYGFGSTPAVITVTLEGNTVFNGEIITADMPIPAMPNPSLESSILCSFELPINFGGEKAMTCSVSNGTVVFAEILANYTPITNPVFSVEDLAIIQNPDTTQSHRVEIVSTYAVPPFSAEEITTLESTDPAEINAQLDIMAAHNVSLTVSSGSSVYYGFSENSRANVVIDGVPTIAPHTDDSEGEWWWKIGSGSTLAYNLVVNTGLE